jgi:hypothetical protein
MPALVAGIHVFARASEGVGDRSGNDEKALAFLDGDQRWVVTMEEVRSVVAGWTAEGFQLRLALSLPSA